MQIGSTHALVPRLPPKAGPSSNPQTLPAAQSASVMQAFGAAGHVPHSDKMLPDAFAGCCPVQHVGSQQISSVAGRPKKAPLSVPQIWPGAQLALEVQAVMPPPGATVSVRAELKVMIWGMLRRRMSVFPIMSRLMAQVPGVTF